MNSCISRRPFCTWMVAGSFLVVFLAVMIIALVFSPIDQGVSKLIPNFEPNEEQRAWILKRDTPAASPTVPLETDGDNDGDAKLPSSSGQQYMFIQCDEGGECCNGNALNCDLRLNEMSFATVHNANSARESSSALGYNHLFDLDGALVAGYRAINLDVCKCDGKIRFCHNFCDFGSRDATQVLLEIMKFVMNPDHLSEVVVLIFQFSTGNPTVEELYEVMQDVDGFTELMYVHPADSNVEWPLMRDLVKKGRPDPKRLVVFQYNGQDCSVASACAPLGINNYFSYTAETNFDFSSIEDMRNVEESCKITRGPKEGATFYGVNTFVTPPNEDAAAIVNSLSFVRRRLNRCAAVAGLIPNFILVDFWSLGDVPYISQARNVALAEKKLRQWL